MNRKHFAAVVLAFCLAIPLAAQDSVTTGAPLVWSSYANVLSNFIPRPAVPLQSPTVSILTLDQGIVVTRIQLHAAIGANNQFMGPCTVLPAVKLTDGTHSVSLTIPNAPMDNEGHFGAVSADTGLFRLEFPANAKLSLVIVPGDNDPPTAFCSATEINVTVQYGTHSGS